MAETINLDFPPRPASGDGDVVLPIAQTDIVFTWTGGDLATVTTVARKEMLFDVKMKKAKPDAVFCKKCATDSDTGREVCWPVPC
ncbi:MAG: hypothetical protein QM692_23735 [Thermomicrobiales bacterium]